MHEFFLATVHDLKVVYEFCESHVTVGREIECVASLAEEFDEVSVVSWRDVRESRVGRVDVGVDSGVEELAHGVFVVWQEFDAAAFGVRWASHSRGCQGAPDGKKQRKFQLP